MAPPAPYATLPAAELASTTAPLAWLADGLFLQGGAGILGGAPKSGKSFFALDLCVAVASATPCAGRFLVADKGRVTLLCAEDPHAVIVDRLRALARSRGLDLAGLPLDVIVEPAVRLPGGVAEDARHHRQDPTPTPAARPPHPLAPRRRKLCGGDVCHPRWAAFPRPRLQHRHPPRPPHPQGRRWSLRRRRPPRQQRPPRASATPTSTSASSAKTAPSSCASSTAPPPVPSPSSCASSSRGSPCSAARFVPVDKSATVEDPLATRLLATLAKADAPMASRALRAALGVRNQLIGTALHTLLAQGRIRRDGRDGWCLSRSDTGSQPL